MKFSIFIFVFFFTNFSANAFSIKCNFEEVHQNGDLNQGIFFLKNDELRYEYFDKNLLWLISQSYQQFFS